MKPESRSMIIVFAVVVIVIFLSNYLNRQIIVQPGVDLVETVDSVAILKERSDSLIDRIYALEAIIRAKELESNLKLEKQRKYYESQINRIKSFSADSNLIFFSKYTSSKFRYIGGGAD